MNNRIRDCWRAGNAAVNFWLSMPSTVSAEVAVRQDLDGVTVDLQHGLIDYSSALPMLQVMSQGDVTPMARVPWLEPGIIMKLLDAGALGIICPMVNSAEEARRLVGYSSRYNRHKLRNVEGQDFRNFATLKYVRWLDVIADGLV